MSEAHFSRSACALQGTILCSARSPQEQWSRCRGSSQLGIHLERAKSGPKIAAYSGCRISPTRKKQLVMPGTVCMYGSRTSWRIITTSSCRRRTALLSFATSKCKPTTSPWILSGSSLVQGPMGVACYTGASCMAAWAVNANGMLWMSLRAELQQWLTVMDCHRQTVSFGRPAACCIESVELRALTTCLSIAY